MNYEVFVNFSEFFLKVFFISGQVTFNQSDALKSVL